MHLPGQMGPLPPVPPEAVVKPSAAVLWKNPGACECRLHPLLSPIEHWAGSICTRKERTIASHFDIYTPSRKSLLFRIYVSEVKFIPCGTLAKSSLLSLQFLRKSRCSDVLRRTGSICCTAHMGALYSFETSEVRLDLRQT